MTESKIKKQKKERPIFGPKSEKQKLVLTDNSTDVLLVGKLLPL